MKSVGQLLQSVRNEKKIDLADVARITRIRIQFLQALENDDYSQLPSGTVARGFIKNYAQFLGIATEQILAIFRRDFMEGPEGRIVPRGLSEPVNEVSLWTPKTTTVAIIVLLLTLFGSYLVYQYSRLIGSPPLTITSPFDKFKTSDTTVEIIGVTDPEATISVNGQLIALDKGGTFRFRIPLGSDQNQVSIVAASKFGKTRSQNLTIYHE